MQETTLDIATPDGAMETFIVRPERGGANGRAFEDFAEILVGPNEKRLGRFAAADVQYGDSARRFDWFVFRHSVILVRDGPMLAKKGVR